MVGSGFKVECQAPLVRLSLAAEFEEIMGGIISVKIGRECKMESEIIVTLSMGRERERPGQCKPGANEPKCWKWHGIRVSSHSKVRDAKG